MNQQPSDQTVRDLVLASNEDHILVSASAGAGKTTIMIEKMKTVLEEKTSHKNIAAITFTIKATNEIKERLKKVGVFTDVVVSTNDSFVEKEIIRPFLKDTQFGTDIKEDFIVSYNNILRTYDEGIKLLRDKNILASYKSDLRKNFKFELAKKILEHSIAARQYLESKYLMIFLDEYQDSDLEMHNLFMYLKNELGIKLFIVGDEKQAIYLWRGAQKDIFARIANENFKKYQLTHNFRCHPEINNFANFIHHYGAFKMKGNDVEKMVLCKTNKLIEDTIDGLIKDRHLNIEEEITLLINTNSTAQSFVERLQKKGYNFVFIPRTPIDEGLLNTYLLRQLATLYFDEYYSIYDFCEAMSLESDAQNIRFYEGTLKLFINKETPTIEKLEEIFDILSKRSGIYLEKEEINKLLETLTNESYKISFLKDVYKHRIMTVFAAKGLEFNQVIALARDYNLESDEKLNAHYVAITRAKEKMIIIDDTRIYLNNLLKIFSANNVSNTEQLFKFLSL